MPKETKRSRGRPPFEPTDEDRHLVRKLAGYGLTHDEISAVIINPQTDKSLDDDTLRKHFPDELREGKAETRTKVARTAYQMAVSGETPAMTMFWLKTQCGWRETDRHELTGADGKDLTAQTIVVLPEKNAGG